MSAKRLFISAAAAVAACWFGQASADRPPTNTTFSPEVLAFVCRVQGGVYSPPTGDNPGGGFSCLLPDGTVIACSSDNQCSVSAFVPTLDGLWSRIFLVSKMLLDKRAEGPADLVALPIPASTPPFGFCRRNDQGQLLIDVYNQGGTGADASTTRVIFENVGVTDIATPALDPRSRTQLAVAIPDACFDANNECRFALGVDAMNAVAESSETNNDVAGACGPQFQ
jgi:hypothetical protein